MAEAAGERRADATVELPAVTFMLSHVPDLSPYKYSLPLL